MSVFHSIQKSTEGLYKEKGSKFLSYAYPVANQEEISQHLQSLRKVHHDARHHCYAWILGLEDQKVRSNDDGEPNHSAGDPILGQIKSFELTNTLVVVVRYFGGTKLGVGGLIHAYKSAAEEALYKAEKQVVFEEVVVNLKFDYNLLSRIERLITDFDLVVLERDYREDCRIVAKARKGRINQIRASIADLYQLQMKIDPK